MAVIVLVSGSGSPGVTTAAVGLALSWPRPCLLVDADPSGSRAILAGYFRGADIGVQATLVDLAVANRQGTLVEDLPRALVRLEESQVSFLCGPLRHTQARSLDALWDPLSGLFRGLERTGQDVIVDAGRLGLDGSPLKLFTTADLAVLVTRSTLPALVSASSWAPTLREVFDRAGGADSLGALVIGPGDPYGPREVTKVLDMKVVSAIADDPVSAAVFSRGAASPRRFDSSPLLRSLRAATHSITGAINHARASLDLPTAERVSP